MNRLRCAGALLVVAFACKKAEPPPAAVEPTPAPERTTGDPACVGPVAAGTPTPLNISGVTYELNGSTLARKAPAKNGTLTLGVLADIKEASEENKANLKTLSAWFAKSKVEMIVLAGDTGETEDDIAEALDMVAAANVPVLAIIGNREGKQAYQRALRAARGKHSNIIDLNLIRRVDTPVVDFISMPGYFNPSYLHAEDGCRYYAADVDVLSALAKASDSPVVLVSHGPPRQEGELAIDRTSTGANAGDPELARVIAEAKIPFGIFANIHEAGGRATNLAGSEVLAQGKPHAALYLNPGPADGVRWMMNDGSESVGMGAVVTFKGGTATYTVQRLPNPNTQ
ncbi:MAG: metallophosphoesterase, partial [Deltaproteobacteria bacterium]|nr:metallophosphoesterase [Deltaproteobacteria bacterium]